MSEAGADGAARRVHEQAHHLGAHAQGRAASTRRLAASLAVVSTIMVAEVAGGWISGSLALLSDAAHTLTDAAALALALFAIHFGARPADDKRTFGFRRAEVLAAQINVATLVGLTGWIVFEAVQRLQRPHPTVGSAVMAATAIVSIAGNGTILLLLRGDRGVNARSAFLHVLGDAVASVGVLAGAGVMAVRPEMQWIDPVLSLGIALLILWGALRLTLEITDILMEAVPRHLELAGVCRLMERTDGVVAVHDVHIWTISSGMYALSAHLVVEGRSVGHNDEILTAVKARLRRECGIDHTTLQIESDAYAHVHDVHTH